MVLGTRRVREIIGSLPHIASGLTKRPLLTCVLVAEVDIGRAAFYNEALERFANDVIASSDSGSIELSLVLFGQDARQWVAQTTAKFHRVEIVTAVGRCTGAAIRRAISVIDEWEPHQRTPAERPWIFLIDMGPPTDDLSGLDAAIRSGERRGVFSFYAVSINPTQSSHLRSISVREPLATHSSRLSQALRWLSDSLIRRTRARPGTFTPLDNPFGPKGWAFRLPGQQISRGGFCSQCGSEAPRHVRYCPFCGVARHAAPPEP